MPKEGKPKGRVFRREGTHKFEKRKGEEGVLNVRGRLRGDGRDDETRKDLRRLGGLRGSRRWLEEFTNGCTCSDGCGSE